MLLGIHQYTLEELQNNVKIYVGNNQESLHIEKMADLIPYYAYIIGSSYHDNKKKKAVIHLSSESFVDREERECLEYYAERLIKIYNRCKRNKIEFDADEAASEVCWICNKEAITELAKRVKENKGKNIDFADIHLEMHDYYRQKLADEMIKNGLNPADFGYGRFVKDGDLYKSIEEQL